MARQHCCSNRAEQAARQRRAEAILAQGRRAAEQLLGGGEASGAGRAAGEEEVPMKRYIHPIPLPSTACGALGCAQAQESLERALEYLACQNQLLVDLLGAVNSLTAAVLSAKSSG